VKTCLPAAMVIGGGGDGDGVEPVAGQQFVEIGDELDAELLGGGTAALGIVVPDDDEGGSGMVLGRARVIARVHVPETDRSDSEWMGHDL